MPKIRSVKTAVTRALKVNPTQRRTVTSGPATAEDHVHVLIQMLRAEYEKHRCPAYAVAMKKYMRGQFDYFGMKSAERRNVDKQVGKLKNKNRKIKVYYNVNTLVTQYAWFEISLHKTAKWHVSKTCYCHLTLLRSETL